MPKADITVTNFTAGEISPLASARDDLSRYYNGCSLLQNAVVHPQGPASRRPGTYFAGYSKLQNWRVTLIPFTFNTEQSYVIEAGHRYMRFWKDYGQITFGGVPYEIKTPYAGEDLSLLTLKWTSKGDVIFLFHPNYPVHTLTRESHTDWVLEEVEWIDGPWMPENSDVDHTLVSDAKYGNVVITSSKSFFRDQHVGTLLRICNTGVTNKSAIAGDDTWSAASKYRNEFYASLQVHPTNGFTGKVTVQRSVDNRVTWHDYHTMTAPGTVDLFEADKNVHYRIGCKTGDFEQGSCVARLFQDEHWGIVEITEVVDPYVANGRTVVDLGADYDTKTERWAQGAWSSRNGYPRCGGFFEDRLWMAGAAGRPQTLVGSMTGDYYNLTLGAKDDAGIDRTLASSDVNAIQWLVAQRNLVVGTSNGEWTILPAGDKPLTPSSFRASQQSFAGGNGLAVGLSNSILFVQAHGRRLMELSYSIESDSLQPRDLTELAEHITQSGIVGLAYQNQPYSILWCLKDDGTLIGLTYLPQQEVLAWHRFVTDGFIYSICTSPGRNGQDDLWLAVRRNIGERTIRTIEYLKPYEFASQNEAFFVDCGLSYTGTTLVTTVSGLDHLEGAEVSVLANGWVSSATVTNGAITLPSPARYVHVGLPYTTRIHTQRLSYPSQGGSPQGKMKRVSRATIRFLNTLGAEFGSPGDLEQIPSRRPPDPMTRAVPLFSGDVQWDLPTDYANEAILAIESSQPLPMTVVAIYAETSVY